MVISTITLINQIQYNLPTQSDASIPIGTILPFAGHTIPEGWLLCDGRNLNITQNPAHDPLAIVLGFNYDPNNSSFLLPDLRGRTIIGAGHASGLTNRFLASTFGEESHVLTTSEMPTHNHGGQTGTENVNTLYYDQQSPYYVDLGSSNRWIATRGFNAPVFHTHIIGSEGDSQPHNNMPPSIVLNYIIKFLIK